MKVYEVIGYVVGQDVYCPRCFAVAENAESIPDWDPIFAGAEDIDGLVCGDCGDELNREDW